VSAAENIQPEELPSTTADLLESVLRQLSISPAERPWEFLIKLHAKNILDLARDVIFLESHGHDAGAPVIARAMLESLFKLGVAVKDPELAARKTLLEFEWDAIQSDMPGSKPYELSSIRQKPEYLPISESIRELSKKWNLPETAFLSDKKFSTGSWARKSGMAYFSSNPCRKFRQSSKHRSAPSENPMT
jgi:hypothetical protein